MKYVSLQVCSIFLTVIAAITGAQSPRELHYALFTSGPEGAFDSSGSIPAMELAEEEILRDPSVLQGYVLNHTSVEDTLVSTLIISIVMDSCKLWYACSTINQ